MSTPWERDWPEDAGEIVSNVDFSLAYKGRLPANGDLKVKDEIRRYISSQLWELLQFEPRLRPEIANVVLAELKGRRLLSVPVEQPTTLAPSSLSLGGSLMDALLNQPRAAGLLAVKLRGRWFIPLVDRRRSLVCHLDIKFLHRDEPGGIVIGGDLDNRIKTFFDALRIPQEENEVPSDTQGLDPLASTFCLLEDDSLITKLSITTEPLLDPLTPGDYRADVRLEIAVSIKARGGEDHWMGKP